MTMFNTNAAMFAKMQHINSVMQDNRHEDDDTRCKYDLDISRFDMFRWEWRHSKTDTEKRDMVSSVSRFPEMSPNTKKYLEYIYKLYGVPEKERLSMFLHIWKPEEDETEDEEIPRWAWLAITWFMNGTTNLKEGNMWDEFEAAVGKECPQSYRPKNLDHSDPNCRPYMWLNQWARIGLCNVPFYIENQLTLSNTLKSQSDIKRANYKAFQTMLNAYSASIGADKDTWCKAAGEYEKWIDHVVNYVGVPFHSEIYDIARFWDASFYRWPTMWVNNTHHTEYEDITEVNKAKEWHKRIIDHEPSKHLTDKAFKLYLGLARAFRQIYAAEENIKKVQKEEDDRKRAALEGPVIGNQSIQQRWRQLEEDLLDHLVNAAASDPNAKKRLSTLFDVKSKMASILATMDD
jgi:hypothetical protein